MARYVMANRRSGKFHETEKEASREAISMALSSLAPGIQVVHDFQPADPTARRVVVFDASPSEVATKSQAFGSDVIVEPEILHYPEKLRPSDFIAANRETLSGPVGTGSTLRVTVTGEGTPLLGAQVHLFLRGFGGLTRELVQVTDDAGETRFSFAPFWQTSALVVAPAGGFWTFVVRGPSSNETVDCPALPEDGPLAWWHESLNVDRHVKSRGKGIRVGVADTGVGPHPGLSHVTDIGAFIDGQSLPNDGADVDSHGTHVCGTIGAQPTNDSQYAGVAPGVKLFSARVFPKDRGANQGDIANAIDELSRRHEADLINLSLGSPTPSNIEQDAIRDALERGTVCVCAAANSAGPVEFPAAFPETVAVSALGLLGWGPPGTLASLRLPQEPNRFGIDQLYLANFSCFGPEITCAAPGVGVISTVPERFALSAPYAAMGGTSMASPAACATLAAVLSKSTSYRAMPRDSSRSQEALQQLRGVCRDIGLDSDFQGRGIPQAP